MDIDLSIPDGAPPDVAARLIALRQELEEGDITSKGYRKHRDQVLAAWTASKEKSERSSLRDTPSIRSIHRESGIDSISSYPAAESSNLGAGQFVARAPSSKPDLSTAGRHLQAPIPPRGIPDTARSDPLNVSVRLTNFDNLPSILRHRGRTNSEIIAFMVLDHKGKESQSITWGKLASRTEKVAQQLREQSRLFRGDRVVLIYTELEPLEFIAALMGCFIAGFVAVPLLPPQINDLPSVLHSTQCHLILSSEAVYKHFHKNNPELISKLKDASWWRTSDWGSYSKRGDLPPLQVPDLAYIDYARSPLGELRGVVMSHRTILHQMTSLTAMLQSRENFKGKQRSTPDRVLCSLDMRRSTGLILGVLNTIYSGNCTYFIPQKAMSTPGLYAHVISRNRMSIIVSDYPALKQVTYNYQSAPTATRNFKKGVKVTLDSLRWCLIDAGTVDTEFQMVLADRWLTPLGNKNSRDIVTPMLSLTEHGGMVIAMRDWLSVNDEQDPSELREVQLDIDALRKNKLEFVNAATGSDSSVPVGPFGFPLPDALVAIVDPETTILSAPMTVGEIWIDSPSLSGGFWGLSEDTDLTFHAHCYDANGPLPMDFLRTGFLGFIEDGELYVLGPLEDRLVQISDQTSNDSSDEVSSIVTRDKISPFARVDPASAVSYFYNSHLVGVIMRSVTQVFDACIFQIPMEGQFLSVVVVETPVARLSPYASQTKEQATKDALMEDMAQQVIAVLRAVHKFEVYCVMVAAPNTTPRIIRSGRPDIAKLLARSYAVSGNLPASHIKFDISNSVTWIPEGQDAVGGIWSPAISHIRSQSLESEDQQFSGVDMRTEVYDDRSAVLLDKFKSLGELFQWRVTRQPDELAYMTISSRPMDSNRETTWRKLDQEVGAVVQYLKEHLRARAGDVALLIYTHSQEFVVAVLACFLMGITVIPLSPINTDRLSEDMRSLVKLVRQFRVTFILGNHETQAMFDDKPVSQYLKQNRAAIGKLHNTAKVKVLPSMTAKNLKLDAKYLADTFPALVWLYWTSDHEFVASELCHSAILGMCKIQKETCQMSATKPIIGCVRSVSGLGFLYTCCLGAYLGASTLLVHPVDYANNPTIYFLTSSRYKVKDGYATTQMLKHATKLVKPKGYTLEELRNIVVATNGRADTDIVNSMRLVFGSAGLEATAVNTAYGSVGNPMIATRSYMLMDSVDIWLDPVALRQGYITLVNPNNCKHAVHLQDSGMVPINTQVAIVNPETRLLCRSGELGEIWVVSDGNQTQFYKGDTLFNKEMMGGVIANGDSSVEYMRTGDFGFLHTVTRGSDVEMQVLFVLGPVSQTIEVNGLQHFTSDVEAAVTAAHPLISHCILFSMGQGLTVLLVETTAPKERLSSMALVVVNKILGIHQFVVDIVGFVGRDKIPISRLSEVQRKTVITSYVNGTLPLLAQYGVQAQG